MFNEKFSNKRDIGKMRTRRRISVQTWVCVIKTHFRTKVVIQIANTDTLQRLDKCKI